MQATIDLHESLSIGDRVHTTSGLQGTITHITDDAVDLEIAPGVVTTWMKLAIRDRIEPETEDVDASYEDEAEQADDDAESIGDSEELTAADPEELTAADPEELTAADPEELTAAEPERLPKE
jgi:preprotein translocase subunit YajC